MKHKPTIKSLVSWLMRFRKLWRLLQKITFGLGLILVVWLISTTITLVSASLQPVDALFVLGGSIVREIYVAQLQYLCHFPVGWVYRVETQRKLNVFVGFRSSTQPTNQDIFDFGEGIVN